MEVMKKIIMLILVFPCLINAASSDGGAVLNDDHKSKPYLAVDKLSSSSSGGSSRGGSFSSGGSSRSFGGSSSSGGSSSRSGGGSYRSGGGGYRSGGSSSGYSPYKYPYYTNTGGANNNDYTGAAAAALPTLATPILGLLLLCLLLANYN
uniref:loricrin-like n=1 Tax=Erigeron canadensis TaxID=72917 RepID=UPI001CB8C5E6|nr:loricrin-like [Erigeron canadensis]XP_043611321.1 loricrin-like [Erigeron canadensis]